MTITLSLKRFCLVVLLFLSLASTPVAAQSKDEIIQGGFLVALGRSANSSEWKHWRTALGGRTIQQMVDALREAVKTNEYEREQTVRRSFLDAFGWQPSDDELRYWSRQNKTYGELMANHVNNWLDIYPDRKKHIIKQSYYKVFGRSATEAELTYWMGQATCSYVQLVAMHATWKGQNQKTSTVTRIQPHLRSSGIATAALSPQAISGVVAAGGGAVVAVGGGSVVAVGSAN